MNLNRRETLGLALGAAAGLVTRPFSALARDPRPETLIVHVTDTHLREDVPAERWTRQCMEMVARLQPDLVIHGGDLIDAGRNQTVATCDQRWEMWQRCIRGLDLNLLYTLGNHDLPAMLGDARDPQAPLAGKRFFAARMGEGRTYRSIRLPNAHVVALDTVDLRPDGSYQGLIDEAQLKWLDEDLARVPPGMPIVLSAHIPVFSIIPQYEHGPLRPVPDWQLVTNPIAFRSVVEKYNVKVVLQGHTHSVDEAAYRGIRYVTSGAVSGNWWNGNRFDVHAPGFGVVALQADGAVWTYRPYGWRAQ
jgi:Icc protein